MNYRREDLQTQEEARRAHESSLTREHQAESVQDGLIREKENLIKEQVYVRLH